MKTHHPVWESSCQCHQYFISSINKRKLIILSENPLISHHQYCVFLNSIDYVMLVINSRGPSSKGYVMSVIKFRCLSSINYVCQAPAALCKCSSLVHQKISKFVLFIWFFQHLPQNLHSVTKFFFSCLTSSRMV